MEVDISDCFAGIIGLALVAHVAEKGGILQCLANFLVDNGWEKWTLAELGRAALHISQESGDTDRDTEDTAVGLAAYLQKRLIAAADAVELGSDKGRKILIGTQCHCEQASADEDE